jgi:hypothetical protein
MMQSTRFSLFPCLLIALFPVILIAGIPHDRCIHSSHAFSGIQGDTDSLLQYMKPDAVDLSSLKETEFKGENPSVIRFLENADRLARSAIGYRKDKRSASLTRADLVDLPDDLSCTEFIWVVYSLSGLNLGNFHIETKELAYDKGVYAPYLSKLKPNVGIRPGDTLVYEYPDEELIKEEEETGRYRSGHAVMVVSTSQKIVVGSHGSESTPAGAPFGVGYRRLLGDWTIWTAGRNLKSIYRLKQTAPGDPVP